MKDEPIRGPEGLWKACEDMELAACSILRKILAQFEDAIQKSYEAGVQVPTLPCRRNKDQDILISSLFLKKALNDLRSMWLLIQFGYTSQAASVAASLFENALAVTCIAGNPSNAKYILNKKSGDLPWNAQQLSKIRTKKMIDNALKRGEKVNSGYYEIKWREIYSGYKWLCKIKHPTLRSALHESRSASVREGEYVIMAAPDLREEDFPVKLMILMISNIRILEAIKNYAEGLECYNESEVYKEFKIRMDLAESKTKEAWKSVKVKPLPFNIRGSAIEQEYAKLRKEYINDLK